MLRGLECRKDGTLQVEYTPSETKRGDAGREREEECEESMVAVRSLQMMEKVASKEDGKVALGWAASIA